MDTQPNAPHVIKQSVDVYIILVLITLFAYTSFIFVSPFIYILIWATIFAVSLYPLYTRLTLWLGGRPKIASTIIAVLGLVFFLAPTFFITQSAFESSAHVIEDLKNGVVDIPAPKNTVKNWPLIGEKAFEIWGDAHANLQKTLQHYSLQIKSTASKIFSISTSIVGSVLQCALSIIFASVFLVYTRPLHKTINTIAKRLNGNSGADFVQMTVSTTRNVSKGIIGVAIIQGGLAAVGFYVLGLPHASLWAIAAIAASTLQVPPLVIIPAIIYAWSTDSNLAALIFTVYMIPVMVSDNVLKPILMAKGLSTPMVIILIGVIGGALTFGILGLFIGPVILAVFYEMVRLWVKQNEI